MFHVDKLQGFKKPEDLLRKIGVFAPADSQFYTNGVIAKGVYSLDSSILNTQSRDTLSRYQAGFDRISEENRHSADFTTAVTLFSASKDFPALEDKAIETLKGALRRTSGYISASQDVDPNECTKAHYNEVLEYNSKLINELTNELATKIKSELGIGRAKG